MMVGSIGVARGICCKVPPGVASGGGGGGGISSLPPLPWAVTMLALTAVICIVGTSSCPYAAAKTAAAALLLVMALGLSANSASSSSLAGNAPYRPHMPAMWHANILMFPLWSLSALREVRAGKDSLSKTDTRGLALLACSCRCPHGTSLSSVKLLGGVRGALGSFCLLSRSRGVFMRWILKSPIRTVFPEADTRARQVTMFSTSDVDEGNPQEVGELDDGREAPEKGWHSEVAVPSMILNH
ncbi:hypothetical protein Taro_034949 [Colocasia esculenta]|uniref:Uncharacterized protein n=1 Tax=Colocasia esculenta TaxID=4460 RepID=A0A843W2C5_COLES|nr:hypothetical protein [Colocasia esculenta]